MKVSLLYLHAVIFQKCRGMSLTQWFSRRLRGLLIMVLFSGFGAIKSMEIPSYLKELPIEMKLAIAEQLLNQPSLEKIFDDLYGLSFADVELYNLIINEPKFKPFYELDEMKNPVKALKIVYENGFQRYLDWSQYLHNKFPYFSAHVFEQGLNVLQHPDSYQAKVEKLDRSNAFYSLLSGADINVPDNDGYTPLMQAVMINDIILAELLLKNGANPNAINTKGVSIVAQAAINKNDELIKLLIKYGVVINNEVIKQYKAFVKDSEKYWNEFMRAHALESKDFEDIRRNFKNLKEALPILEQYRTYLGKSYISNALRYKKQKEKSVLQQLREKFGLSKRKVEK